MRAERKLWPDQSMVTAIFLSAVHGTVRRRAQSPSMGAAADQPPPQAISLSEQDVDGRHGNRRARGADAEQDQQARIQLGGRDRNRLLASMPR